jgi:site-specific recombinase XerD
MTQNVIPCSTVGPPSALNTTHVELFLARQRALGYAACKLRDKCRIIQHFVDWAQMMELSATEIVEVHVIEYLEAFEHLSQERLRFKRALLLAFLRHLRHVGVIPNPEESVEQSPAIQFEQDYADYLRDERGLSFRSLLVYLPPVRTFLADFAAESRGDFLCDLNAEMIRAFLLGQLDDRAGESARLLIIALRSFLRFLFLRGVTQIDFSSTVTPMRKTRGAEVHAFLSQAELDRVLSAPDLQTPVGRRDHAILLLLARLGLRAGEVVALELDDICWRSGEIVVHSKGGGLNRLPLLKDVGTALALYLESARGASECRRVFLRRFAPRVGFSGPAAVGHVVRQHMERAGVHRPSRVAAHLFRHTLATGMLHHGASLTEISEVLRHRSVTTTEIYAKVAFESLREVARPWPDEEVVR